MEEKQTRRVGRIGQIRVYTGKFFRIFIFEKDWKLLAFAVLISVMLAVVLGGDMFKKMEYTKTAMFAIVCSLLWVGVFNSVQTVCRERQIIKREHRTGLHISSYVAAHMIYQAVLCLVQSFAMLLIYKVFIDLPTKGAVTGSFFFDALICFFMIAYASDMMGLAISSVVKTPMAAMTIMPFMLIVQLVLSSIVFPLHGKAEKLSNLTICKWGLKVLCIESDLNNIPSTALRSELKLVSRKIDGAKEWIDLIPDDTIDELSKELTYNEAYVFDAGEVKKEWAYLGIFVLVFAAVSVASLEFIDYDKR